jgi:hypothetical protein
VSAVAQKKYFKKIESSYILGSEQARAGRVVLAIWFDGLVQHRQNGGLYINGTRLTI